MMQPELEKVAEAIRDELASSTLSKDFTPRESYDPNLELEDADTLRVDVVPVKSDPERQDRGTIAWSNIVDIGIRFRFGSAFLDDDTGDVLNRHMHELFFFEQELVTWFFQNPRLANYENAVMMGSPELRVGWVPKHFAQWRQFTGIIRVTYQTETEINP